MTSQAATWDSQGDPGRSQMTWGPVASCKGPVFHTLPLASECAITPTNAPENHAAVIGNLSRTASLSGDAEPVALSLGAAALSLSGPELPRCGRQLPELQFSRRPSLWRGLPCCGGLLGSLRCQDVP